MRYKAVFGAMKGTFQKKARYFIVLAGILLAETFLSLFLPQILGDYIDHLDIWGNLRLAGCALGYCCLLYTSRCV